MADGHIGLYPGTFDPATRGHTDIIKRAAQVVDRLIVGVAGNAGKGPLFTVDERVAMVKDEIASIADRSVADNISVTVIDGLLVHCAAKLGATVLIRGLRAVTDFEYEIQMASLNKSLDANIETVFLMASDRHQFISSRFVKEIGSLGGDISHFVSPLVAERLLTKFNRGDKVQAGAASKAY
jgi:pantetheine-phosphate adenylyltransferase